MTPFAEPLWISPEAFTSSPNQVAGRGLDSHPIDQPGSLSPERGRVILIVGLTSASISLLIALVAFSWFASMRRTFRHHLIFLLIISDVFKAVWYFIFPVIVFTHGKVKDSDKICQTSGFFLALGTEASDCAILIIAIHSLIYVFRPPKARGEGGLHRYRYFVYALWAGLPILLASLAFTNPAGGYVATSTYCYLPKRPLIYRLALSWIPRYIIFITIFTIYASISVYVHIKFKGFGELGPDVSTFGQDSRKSTLQREDQERTTGSFGEPSAADAALRGHESPKRSVVSALNHQKQPISGHAQTESTDSTPEWESTNFITAPSLTSPKKGLLQRIASTDFAPNSNASSDTQIHTRNGSLRSEQWDTIAARRKDSEVPTLRTNFTGDTLGVQNSMTALQTTRTDGMTQQIEMTRNAIRRQLRYLFIYPAIYLIMWIFPFVSHCLQYSDYWVQHPPFWLAVITTFILPLQAGVDSVVFSWSEKPWRKLGGPALLSTERLKKLKSWTFSEGEKSNHSAGSTRDAGDAALCGDKPKNNRDSHWWEEEGKKRKDSVWLGTDAIHEIVSRRDRAEDDEEIRQNPPD